LVFGRRAALAALSDPVPSRHVRGSDPRTGPEEPVTDEIRRRMWQDCGLVRDAAGLERLLTAPHPFARLVARSALEREESRGSHSRVDFPAESDRFAGHVVLRPGSEPTVETWL